MSEKLTLQDCFKYPKAKIQEYEKEILFKKCSDFANVLDLIYWFSYNREFDEFSYDDIMKNRNCKLQLRPLSSLTDEEKKYIEKIYMAGSKYEVIFTASKHCQDIIYSDDIDILDYLRSINIHVGDLPEGVYEYE